eukprot:jgi/Mesvir1/13477/Mv16532-RA.4
MSSPRVKRRRTAVNYARLHDGEAELVGAPEIQQLHDPTDQLWEPEIDRKSNPPQRDKRDQREGLDSARSAHGGSTQLDVKMMTHRVIAARVGEGAVLRLRAQDLADASRLLAQGLTAPVLVANEGSGGVAQMGMRLPPGLSSIEQLAEMVGHDREIRTVDVATQITIPRFVREMDLVGRVWPKEEGGGATALHTEAPKVQLYALMSIAGCYTDFHVDFGGSSVWYHVVSGEKVFLMAPPRPGNLKMFEQWASSPFQAMHFLGDHLTDCCKCTLQPGDTFFIPGGWPHAVVTPKDSVVVGGNFLHGFDLRTQLEIWWMEERLAVAPKYRFPRYQQLMWYTAAHMLERLCREYGREDEPYAMAGSPMVDREVAAAGRGDSSQHPSLPPITLKVKLPFRPKVEQEPVAEAPAGDASQTPAAAPGEESAPFAATLTAVASTGPTAEPKTKPVVLRLRLSRQEGAPWSPSALRSEPGVSHPGREVAAASSGGAPAGDAGGAMGRRRRRDSSDGAAGPGGGPARSGSPARGTEGGIPGPGGGHQGARESAGSGGICLATEEDEDQDAVTSGVLREAGDATRGGEPCGSTEGPTVSRATDNAVDRAACLDTWGARGQGCADVEDRREGARGNGIRDAADGVSADRNTAVVQASCRAPKEALESREEGMGGHDVGQGLAVKPDREEPDREEPDREADREAHREATASSGLAAHRKKVTAEAALPGGQHSVDEGRDASPVAMDDGVKDWRQEPLTLLEKKGLPALVRALRAMLKAVQGADGAPGGAAKGAIPVANPERLLHQLDVWAQKFNPVEKVKLKVRIAGADAADAAQASGEQEASNPFSKEGTGHVLTQMPAQEEVVGIEDIGSPRHRDRKAVVVKPPKKKGSVRDRLMKKLMIKR